MVRKRGEALRLVGEEMLDSFVQSARPVFYTVGAELWRIDADGSHRSRLDRVEAFDGIIEGWSRRALVSPDHAWIAFTRGMDLWLRSAEPGATGWYYRWYDDNRLLLSEPLRLVDVRTGEAQVLADHGLMVPVGQP